MAIEATFAPRPARTAGNVRIERLPRTLEVFGALVDFLSRMEPFARYDLGNFARALQHQLAHGNHVAAVTSERIVGYCGWLPTTSAMAAAWVEDRGQLLPVTGNADAVVLTVVACGDRTLLAALIRRARNLNPGKRVYFRRQYADPRRVPRKSSVKNVAG
jgi:hypothetical protein